MWKNGKPVTNGSAIKYWTLEGHLHKQILSKDTLHSINCGKLDNGAGTFITWITRS